MPTTQNGTVQKAPVRPAVRVGGEPALPPLRRCNSEIRPREYLTPADVETLCKTHGTSLLCWSCHLGLLHGGIISVEEVLAAEAATHAGTRKVTHDEVYRQIAADLAAGRRQIDYRALHNQTPDQLSENAQKAWETRLARQREKTAQGYRQGDLLP
jgi:hypothetical protein